MLMLNEDLFTEDQKKIMRLTHTIEQFKKYDAERKKHYSKLELEVGMLRSERDELRDIFESLAGEKETKNVIKILIDENLGLRKQISILARKQNLSKASSEEWAQITDDEVDDKTKRLKYVRQINKLNETIKKLKKANQELLYRILQPIEAKEIVEKMNNLLSELTGIAQSNEPDITK